MSFTDTFTSLRNSVQSKSSQGQGEDGPATKPLDMPYAGSIMEDQDAADFGINAGKKTGELALSGWHMLLSGLSGAGKGRRVFCPNIIMWGDQPVVAMSTKGDLVSGTIAKRAQRGPVYLMDLTGEVTDEELQGIDVTRVKCDPCALINSDDEAMRMSDLLQATADIGSPSGAGGGSKDSTWENLAARPLAALLRAGGAIPHPETGEAVYGGGVEWVLQALDNPPKRAKDGELEIDPNEVEFVTPSWHNAHMRAKALLESRHAGPLRGVMKMVDKQRDSVAINLRNALNAWSLDAVLGDADTETFYPEMLEQPGATLYLTSPANEAAAQAACAVIEMTIQWWRRNVSRGMPTLGLFLDELAQSAPIPHLPEHISVLRGYNVRLIAGVQNTTQLKRRYKDSFEEMLTTFPSVLIMPGTPEKELLEQAAWLAGEDERVSASVDGVGHATHSSDRVARYTSSELMPRQVGTGRLLIGAHAGLLVSLPDIEATDLLD